MIEQDKESVPKVVLEYMQEYCRKSKDEQQVTRRRSRKSSLVIFIVLDVDHMLIRERGMLHSIINPRRT